MIVNPNIEAGLRIREKYYFYVIALTFTILGLSIQTANFEKTHFSADFLEIISWVLLFLSGIIGLVQIERTYRLFLVKGNIENLEETIRKYDEISKDQEYTEGLNEGELESMDIARYKAKSTISKATLTHDTIIELLDNGVTKRKFTFLTGIFTLISARSIEPIASIAEKLSSSC